MSSINGPSSVDSLLNMQQATNTDPVVLANLKFAIVNDWAPGIQMYGEQAGLRQAYIDDLKTAAANLSKDTTAGTNAQTQLTTDQDQLATLNNQLNGQGGYKDQYTQFSIDYQNAMDQGNYPQAQYYQEQMDALVLKMQSTATQINTLQNTTIPDDQAAIVSAQQQVTSDWNTIYNIEPNLPHS